MSVQMQLKALEQEISDIHAKHADVLKALAAAEQAGDAAEIDLQRSWSWAIRSSLCLDKTLFLH